MVYFIATYSEPILFKVGYTGSSITERLKSIQTGCPYELHVYATIYGEKSTEREIHKMLKEYRMSGEWFNVPLAVVNELLPEYGTKAPPLWKEVYDGQTGELLAVMRESDRAVFIPVRRLPKLEATIYMHTSSHEVIGFPKQGYFIDLREIEKDWPTTREHFAEWRKLIQAQECRIPGESALFISTTI